jgi:hypothetical protein
MRWRGNASSRHKGVPICRGESTSELRCKSEARAIQQTTACSGLFEFHSHAGPASVPVNEFKLVEAAFEERIAKLAGGSATDETPNTDAIEIEAAGIKTDGTATAGSDTGEPATAETVSAVGTTAGGGWPQRIDKSVLARPEPRRYRNKEHLRFVASKPCVICGRKPSDPHHLRFVQPRALGRKASDDL